MVYDDCHALFLEFQLLKMWRPNESFRTEVVLNPLFKTALVVQDEVQNMT